MSHTINALVPELMVTDIQKSLHFYVEILGFKIDYQRAEEGFAFLSFGGGQLMLDEIHATSRWKTGEFEYPLGRGINFEIEVPDAEKLIDRLKQHNIELYMNLEEKWYRKNNREVGNRQFLVQDPDGYLLRFAQDLGERTLS